MRYLGLLMVIVAYAFASPAFAQVCCPAGCVQNGNSCQTTGANPRTCNRVSCPPSPGNSSGGSGSGQTYVSPVQLPSQCIDMNPTQATVDAATNECGNDLTGNAMFWGRLFEDDS